MSGKLKNGESKICCFRGKRQVKCRNFTILKDVLHQGSVDLTSEQQQQFAIGRTLVTRPCLLLLGVPTAGIQPSIIQDIGRAISYLRNFCNMTIVLVEQFFEFALDLAGCFTMLECGEAVITGNKKDLDETDVQRYFTV